MSTLFLTCLMVFNGVVGAEGWCENAEWSLQVNQDRISLVRMQALTKGEHESLSAEGRITDFDIASCLIDNSIEECSEFSEY